MLEDQQSTIERLTGSNINLPQTSVTTQTETIEASTPEQSQESVNTSTGPSAEASVSSPRMHDADETARWTVVENRKSRSPGRSTENQELPEALDGGGPPSPGKPGTLSNGKSPSPRKQGTLGNGKPPSPGKPSSSEKHSLKGKATTTKVASAKSNQHNYKKGLTAFSPPHTRKKTPLNPIKWQS